MTRDAATGRGSPFELGTGAGYSVEGGGRNFVPPNAYFLCVEILK